MAKERLITKPVSIFIDGKELSEVDDLQFTYPKQDLENEPTYSHQLSLNLNVQIVPKEKKVVKGLNRILQAPCTKRNKT